MSVVLAGGGTAGHIEPALAFADALRRADPELGIVCLGTERGLETRLVPMRGYELALIPPVPLPRKLTPELLSVPGRLNASVAAAARVLEQARAQVLVGFGGYVATPAYLAARRRHVPIVVHEANARPGLANRIGARFTRHVFTGQPDTKLPHATYIGIPLRQEIAGLDRLAMADKARAHFGLRPDLPVLLVTGGSQGARSLNYAVLDAADSIRAAGLQVLHILGPRSDIEVQLPPTGPPYVTLPYVDRMDLAYAAADFAICRSGAMTCAELTAVGLPAAYVPLPHGNGEQRLNALPMAAAGGGLIVDRRGAVPGVDPLRPAADPDRRPARGGDVAGGRGDRAPRHRRPAGRRGPGLIRGGPPPRGTPGLGSVARGVGSTAVGGGVMAVAGRPTGGMTTRGGRAGDTTSRGTMTIRGGPAGGTRSRRSTSRQGGMTIRGGTRSQGGTRSRGSRARGTTIRMGGTTGRGRRAVAAAGLAAGAAAGRDPAADEDDSMGLVTPTAPVPLDELGRVHFTGIGGAGMSGIARIMLARGVQVSGSDAAASALLAELAAAGARVHVGHDAAHLAGADTLVVSTAIRPDNPELAAARQQGLRVLHRAAALASVMLGQRTVAVAGTHGKTTTTSMLTTVLRDCGADPSYVIGGILAETGLGADEGSGELFVAEADESDGSFLMLAPDAAIVTCVEADHLDNYADLAEIEAAFAAFAGRISPAGCWWPVRTTRAPGPWPTPPVSCRCGCAPTARRPTPTTRSPASHRAA